MPSADENSIVSTIFDGALTSVESVLFMVRDHLSLGNVTYHLSQTVVSSLSVDSPYVKTTYPADWVSRYLLRRYIETDPILREGMQRVLPFEWSEVKLRPDAVEMMADFAAHGFDVNGYTVPIVDKAGRRSLFSINAKSHQSNWRETLNSIKPVINEIAYLVHKLAINELFGDQALPNLAPRELEVLTWAARGKDYVEISIILGISQNTVRSYTQSARLKLDCSNIAAAVTKATKLRLIRP